MTRVRFLTALATAAMVLGIAVVVTEPQPSQIPAVAVSPRTCSHMSIGFAWRLNPGVSEQGDAVEVTNTGSRSCVLDGYPKLTLLTSAGKVLPFTYTHASLGYVTSAPPRRVTLLSGKRAYVLFGRNIPRCAQITLGNRDCI